MTKVRLEESEKEKIRPESPTTKAAKALEMLNNKVDRDIASSSSDSDVDEFNLHKYRNTGDEALADA